MAEDFSGMIADRIRGERQARLMREREMYRTNPSRLAGSGMPSTADLPGYDPTQTEGTSTAQFDPVFNAVADRSGEPVVRFSRPMTPEQQILERNKLRNFYPIPSASAAPAAGDYDINAIFSMLNRAGAASGPAASALEVARNMPGSSPALANAAVPNNPALPSAGMGGSEQMFDRPGLPDDTLGGFSAATPRQDDGRADYNALFQSLMATPQRGGPTSTGSIASPAAAPSPMGGLFSGPDYQSNNQAVVSRPQGPMSDGSPQRTMLNFGDSENAADFFRADKAMQELRRNNEDFVGMASGGAANGSSGKASSGRDAALQKALEIIHHMMVNRR